MKAIALVVGVKPEDVKINREMQAILEGCPRTVPKKETSNFIFETLNN